MMSDMKDNFSKDNNKNPSGKITLLNVARAVSSTIIFVIPLFITSSIVVGHGIHEVCKALKKKQ